MDKNLKNERETMITMSLSEFQDACKAQARSHLEVVFKCPMCTTLQSAQDLIDAGAGESFDEVEKYLGFSCVGRFTGAKSPRENKDGEPCDWTLGGLLSLHKFAVVTPDGKHHARFELASKADADAHRAKKQAA